MDDTLVPDLGGWRRERLPSVPNVAAVTLTPDWVCEILSPSTERLDRVTKLPAYARHGVGHAWLINPSTRTLEVYRRDGTIWVLASTFADDAIVRAEPFDAIELDLVPLWGGKRPPRRAEAAGPTLEATGRSCLGRLLDDIQGSSLADCMPLPQPLRPGV